MSSSIGAIIIAQDLIEIASVFFQSLIDTIAILSSDFDT